MRKFLLLVTIMFNMNIMMNAQTKSEMNGAGEYKFGLSKTECISILNKHKISFHLNKDDKNELVIKNIKIGTIIFEIASLDFSNEGLYEIYLIKNGAENSNIIYDVLLNKYGVENSSDINETSLYYLWNNGNNKTIFLNIDTLTNDIGLIYSDKKLKTTWKEFLSKKNNESF